MPYNVLYLVLDCLRSDAVTPSRTPTLARLAAENRSFEACVAPAHWSLPSHASILSGEYPHEHGCYHRGHRLDSLPLVESFADRGYATVGLTSNIYFSRGQGFDAGFDEFYETRRPLNPRGLNPFSAVRERASGDEHGARTYLRVLADAARHERPVASLGNYLRAVAMELDRRYDLRDRLPGVDADRYGFLTRASDRSERLLRETLERHAGSDRPLFAFVNFMDAHAPYQPSERHFERETGGDHTLADLRAVDPYIANSWRFLEEHYGDGVDEEDLALIRAAYRAEVRALDERVGRLLDDLDRLGMREGTLVVVTADHGECLGEPDLRRERSMGHLGSLSEHLRTVPLVLAAPGVEARSVERHVPLQAVSNRLMAGVDGLVDSPDPVADQRTDDPVLFELPANPYHESSYEGYENIPEWYVRRETATHTVVGHDGQWVVVADSAGTTRAWRDGEERDAAAAPSTLVAACTDAVASYPDAGDGGAGDDRLTGALEQQLEDLGYL